MSKPYDKAGMRKTFIGINGVECDISHNRNEGIARIAVATIAIASQDSELHLCALVIPRMNELIAIRNNRAPI